MLIFSYFLSGAIMLLLGGFVFQNFSQNVTVRFLYWEFPNLPLILLIAIAFAIGLAVQYLIAFTHWIYRKRLENVREKAIKQQQAESIKKEKDNSLSISEEAKKKVIDGDSMFKTEED